MCRGREERRSRSVCLCLQYISSLPAGHAPCFVRSNKRCHKLLPFNSGAGPSRSKVHKQRTGDRTTSPCQYRLNRRLQWPTIAQEGSLVQRQRQVSEEPVSQVSESIWSVTFRGDDSTLWQRREAPLRQVQVQKAQYHNVSLLSQILVELDVRNHHDCPALQSRAMTATSKRPP